MCLKSTEHI
jgi:Ethanolamine utilization protein EutJ (predicted chaperonin)